MSAVPEAVRISDRLASMFQNIPLTAIRPDPNQPRRHFDESALDELAQSIAANGLAVPVLVRPVDDGFMLVHGERRWRAIKRLGWETIPTEIRNLSNDKAARLSLIENIQRQDLSPIEEARAYCRLLDTGLTQAQLADQIGKGQSFIAQKLRLLKLPDFLLILVDQHAISENHARQLMKLEGWYHGVAEDLPPLPDEKAEELKQIAEAFAPEELVFWLLLSFRPEQGDGGMFPKQHIEVCQKSARLFLDRWLNGGRVQAWEHPAWWYGVVSAGYGVNVADLARLLDKFHARILSSVGYWRCNGQYRNMTIGESCAAMIWRGVRADLEAAGLFSAVSSDELPPKLINEAGNYVLQHNGYLLPSALQPGSILREERARYLELEAVGASQ